MNQDIRICFVGDSFGFVRENPALTSVRTFLESRNTNWSRSVRRLWMTTIKAKESRP